MDNIENTVPLPISSSLSYDVQSELVRMVLAYSPTGKIVVDKDYRIVFFNAQIERLFGYTAKELLDRPLEDVIPIDLTDKNRHLYIEELKTPKEKIGKDGLAFKGRRHGGGSFPVELSLVSLKIRDVEFLLVEISDLSEKKILEQVTRTNAEMEEFAYSIAHDMNTHARHICSFAQFLQEKVAQLDDPEANKWLATIIESSTQMEKMITDTLSFTRISGAGMEIESVDLNELVDQITLFFKDKLNELQATFTRDSLPTVNGCYHYLFILFVNLIENALKYHEASRKLQIHIFCIDLGLLYKIHVKDTAKGVAAGSLSRIFKIFQRSDVTRKLPGTGMGLAIAKKVVSLHGGTISVNSIEGEGSDFVFTLRKNLNSIFTSSTCSEDENERDAKS